MFAMQFYLSVNPLWHLGGVLWELSVYLRIWTLNMNRTVSTWRYGHRTWTEPCLLEDMDTEHEQNRVYLRIWTLNTNRTVSTWGYGHWTWTEPCFTWGYGHWTWTEPCLLEDMDTEHEQNRVYLRIWTLNMNRTVFHLQSVLRVIIYNFALVLYPDRHYTLRSFCFRKSEI